ncbi:MAG: DedA family protein [Betaproteobacteria bacterium]|nr:MAG: DedA family protein [Betaproteobacteria bacterium]
MEILQQLIAFFGTLDDHLTAIAQSSPVFFFAVVATIIFVETGVVVMPFLPGDSLLFVAGAITAIAGLNVHLLVAILIVAAVAGDSLNYFIGSKLGLKAFDDPNSRVFKRAYLERTQAFYAKYGAFSIVMGRFVPIVRTFVPFLAGVAQMSYRTFFFYNVVGGVLWITSLTYAGYIFGNLPWVKDNLSLIVIGIIVLSVMPMVIKFWQERRAARA